MMVIVTIPLGPIFQKIFVTSVWWNLFQFPWNQRGNIFLIIDQVIYPNIYKKKAMYYKLTTLRIQTSTFVPVEGEICDLSWRFSRFNCATSCFKAVISCRSFSLSRKHWPNPWLAALNSVIYSQAFDKIPPLLCTRNP